MRKIYVQTLREVSNTLIKGEELLKVWGYQLLPGEKLGDLPLSIPPSVRLRDMRQAVTFPLPDTLEMDWEQFKALWNMQLLESLTKPLGFVYQGTEPNWFYIFELGMKVWGLWFDKLETIATHMLTEITVTSDWNEADVRVAAELNGGELQTAKAQLLQFYLAVIAMKSVEMT